MSREDRIVAEFGDGHDVEGIAARYGLTVAQVYAVVEREVGPAVPGLPGHHPPPGHYAAPPAGAPGGYPPPPGYYASSPAGPPGYHAAPPGYPPAPPGPGYYGPPVHQGQPPPPQQYAPPAAYTPPAPAVPVQGYAPPQGFPDDDAIVAEYGDGHAVEEIARRHGIGPERVYEVVQRVVVDDFRPPAGPPPSG